MSGKGGRLISDLTDKRGLTLVELIISLALLGVVLSVGYSFYAFGNRSFDVGENRSVLQRDIRAAAAFITKEVRYTNRLRLTEFPESPPREDHSYIFLEESALKHIDGTGSLSVKTEVNVTALAFSARTINNRIVLSFRIEGEKDGQRYAIESEVLLLNVSSYSGAPSGSTIRYRKPESE